MKFLIIGLGSMGKRRIKNLIALGIESKDIFAFEPREDRRKEAKDLYKIKTFNNFEEAMEQNPDVLIISSPPHTHIEYALKAIEKDKHFFTEINWPQDFGLYCKMIKELKKNKDIVGAPSCSLRYHPRIKKIKELVGKNALGKILLFNYHSGQWLADWHPWENLGDFFVSDKDKGGGREHVIFELNWICWVMGKIKSMSAKVKKLSSLPINAYDTYSLLLEFEKGAVGNVVLESIQRDPNRFCKIESEDGLIIWNWKERSLKIYQAKNKIWKEFPDSPGYRGYSTEEMYQDEMKDFLAAISKKKKYPMTFEDEKYLIETALSAEKASKAKKEIEIQPKDKPFWRIGEDEIDYIKKSFNLGFKGEFNARLEKAFAKKFGVNYAVGVNSGNSALHCALFALGVKEGDEVIVSPLTFASPAFAALYLGAKPVFADVDPNTWTIDPEDIEKKITEKTKAIITVSLYGLPPDLESISKIAKKHKIALLEDNAQCLLAECNGRKVGTFGQMSIFSFERSKHITTGNGGMIITDDETLAERARKFSILGYSTLTATQSSYKELKEKVQRPDFERHETIGYNYRLPEICAAVAFAQLKKADFFVKKRQKIAEFYKKVIKKTNLVIPQKIPKGLTHSFWTYALALDTNRVSLEDFRKIFLKNGGQPYYAAWLLTYDEPFLRNQYKKGICPVAENLQPRLIQLKTNFGDLNYAQRQADILSRTIRTINSRLPKKEK